MLRSLPFSHSLHLSLEVYPVITRVQVIEETCVAVAVAVARYETGGERKRGGRKIEHRVVRPIQSEGGSDLRDFGDEVESSAELGDSAVG